MAQDVHALAQSLGIQKAGVAATTSLDGRLCVRSTVSVGVDRLALLDAFIPGIGDTTNRSCSKTSGTFHFYGPTPLALVKGRERTYFEHFWNDFAPTERSRSRKPTGASMRRSTRSPAR
jgi:hypothetical protein